MRRKNMQGSKKPTTVQLLINGKPIISILGISDSKKRK